MIFLSIATINLVDKSYFSLTITIIFFKFRIDSIILQLTHVNIARKDETEDATRC